MAKIKQYKIARRLGVRIFPKTENPKFTPTRARRTKKYSRPMSEFGLQMLEKQKARYGYGLRERQFANYVAKATARKDVNSMEYLYRMLESRLDNIVYRLGFAKTRAFARQMVSHGHIVVNKRKNSIPSYEVKIGDVISLRGASRGTHMGEAVALRVKEYIPPVWLSLDVKNMEGTMKAAPPLEEYSGSLFNLSSIIEFYSR